MDLHTTITACHLANIQKKKNSINKGKLKKTIKNVLCRPDPVFWPTVSYDHGKQLEESLYRYKVQIPDFKKPHWKEIQKLPKEERPKPPKIEKVDGLIMGISKCLNMIQSGECMAIIVESTVNPRSIVQPVLDACVNKKVPALCLNGLRTISTSNFGIKTCCLGIKANCLTDLKNKVIEISKSYKPPQEKLILEKANVEEMDVEDNISTGNSMEIQEATSCYLYRTNKKARVFKPPADGKISKTIKQFVGQNFIEFSEKSNSKNMYMKMMVKRISNNPNRGSEK